MSCGRLSYRGEGMGLQYVHREERPNSVYLELRGRAVSGTNQVLITSVQIGVGQCTCWNSSALIVGRVAQNPVTPWVA